MVESGQCLKKYSVWLSAISMEKCVYAFFHFLFGWCPYRDISFLCDANPVLRKTRQLPPLTDRSDTEDTEVTHTSPF